MTGVQTCALPICLVLLVRLRRAGAQSERQVGRAEADKSGQEWHETDEAPPVFEIAAGAEDTEADDNANNAIDAANIGFHNFFWDERCVAEN